MPQDRVRPLEETLDPEDWKAMRELEHRRVDDMLDPWKRSGRRLHGGTSLTRRIEPDSRRKDFDVLVRGVNQIGEGV